MIFRFLLIIPSIIILGQEYSCRPESYVRNLGFIRSHFYPEVYARNGIGDNTTGKTFDNTDYGIVLKRYVNDDGFVDYSLLAANSSELDMYIEKLSIAGLDELSKYSRLSVFLNAYNAFTLKLITENKGIKSIKDIPEERRWKDKRWVLGGQTVSLDELEHEMIRKTYGDARVHFALVCAAKSCPKLRNEPYSEEKLITQLDDQARKFCKQGHNFRWDAQNNTVYLSQIFDWFRNDFADDEKGVLDYVKKYLNEDTAKEISSSKNVKIKYIPYDWSLNGTWK